MATFQNALASDLHGLTKKQSLWDYLFWDEDPVELALAYEKYGITHAQNMIDSRAPASIGATLGPVQKIELREIGYKLISAADCFISERSKVDDLHYYYARRGDFFFRWREVDDFALDEAIESYKGQISIAPEAMRFFTRSNHGLTYSHRGFSQLRKIEEKRRNYPTALALCETAKSQGWGGDWDKHTMRLQKKLSKLATASPLET